MTQGKIERSIMQQRHENPAFAADLAARLSTKSRFFSDRILAFGAAEAHLWGRLSAQLGNTSADLLIAATAIAAGACVVTENVNDFLPTGVAVESPFI
jgi:predicted nucleic acid-binding protein